MEATTKEINEAIKVTVNKHGEALKALAGDEKAEQNLKKDIKKSEQNK